LGPQLAQGQKVKVFMFWQIQDMTLFLFKLKEKKNLIYFSFDWKNPEQKWF